MLLLHQTGSVKVGEVVRYNVTYTPSLDRILPPPTQLHVKIRNTSSIPLRAAYLHGPYTLYVASYPSTFDPNKKHTTAEEEGEPDYEPQLKAGGSWNAQLTVPERVRQGAGLGEHVEGKKRKSFTWIIEIASQVLFSTTASVHYELLVGRDAKSVSLTFGGVVSGHGLPGRLEDFQNSPQPKGNAPARGVFTRAVDLKVQDTAMLWSTPAFPSFEDEKNVPDVETRPPRKTNDGQVEKDRPRKRRKRIHLVIITHGLHSNLGADMLYMKESIDATAKQARKDARMAKKTARKEKASQENDFGRSALDQRSKSAPALTLEGLPSEDEIDVSASDDDDVDDSDEEEVLVRGFNGNAVRTERGIQYLGKRLAKYVLSLTYPDQPYLPVKSSITQSISRTFTGTPRATQTDGKRPAHKNSSIAKDTHVDTSNLAYQISSISFVSHSLGGLVQTYAVAYIQKHSPEFFDKIKPVNFVAMASPFLGLSNENPMYVKFALDFGLVGRTGQDLGLTWRAPTIARNGWGAMVGPFTNSDSKDRAQEPGTKPLLRILPTGPAHVALKRFRNRSVYSNVVNDGIVPLRTSCLLFLDWRGLGRVEKAQRESGLVGTMVNWGLNELTGQNASAPRRGFLDDLFADSGDDSTKPESKSSKDRGSTVPQADVSTGLDDIQHITSRQGTMKEMPTGETAPAPESSANFWSTLTSFFKPQASSQPKKEKEKDTIPKHKKAFQRGQTMTPDSMSVKSQSTFDNEPGTSGASSPSNHRKLLVRGSSLYTNASENEELEAPPRTTVFESAGDLLNPPLPPKQFLLDPESRPRTIFHDRVYHPEDIPPPAMKRQRTFLRSRSSAGTGDDSSVPNQASGDMMRVGSSGGLEEGGMRIEEKIARAYHKDLAWRKVLVRLEPDAHNNIIVRRMFANAYGWPVVKHMCDTHFAYTAAAKTRDDDTEPVERARARDKTPGRQGEEVRDQTAPPAQEELAKLKKTRTLSTYGELPNKTDGTIETLHLRHKNIQAVKAADSITNRSHRSPSEARESTDKVPDLVSLISAQGQPSESFSSMRSGSAALHRLSRQDSARWSDRYFDSEEEEDDETELDAELARAYDRGGPQGSASRAAGQSARKGSRQYSKTEPGAISDTKEMSTEPDEMSRRNSEDVPVIDTQTLSLTGIGLGKDVRHGLQNEESSSEGISKQIARARGNSGSGNKP